MIKYGFDVVLTRKGRNIVETQGQYPLIKVFLNLRINEILDKYLLEDNGVVKSFYGRDFFECIDISGNHALIGRDKLVLNSKLREEEILNSFLEPSILFAEYLHKRLVLHGSVFGINKKAYLVIAPSGTGKSTLVTAMIKYMNAFLIADDLAVISEDMQNVYSGDSHIRLCKDTEEKLCNKFEIESIREIDMKRELHFKDDVRKQFEYNIAGIIVLENEDTKNMDIKRIKGHIGMLKIIENIKPLSIIESSYFDFIMQKVQIILEKIPIYQVALRREYNLLPQQMDLLVKYLTAI